MAIQGAVYAVAIQGVVYGEIERGVVCPVLARVRGRPCPREVAHPSCGDRAARAQPGRRRSCRSGCPQAPRGEAVINEGAPPLVCVAFVLFTG